MLWSSEYSVLHVAAVFSILKPQHLTRMLNAMNVSGNLLAITDFNYKIYANGCREVWPWSTEWDSSV